MQHTSFYFYYFLSLYSEQVILPSCCVVVVAIGNRPVTEMQHTGRRAGTGGGIPSSAGETDAFQRRKGESLREYLERLDVESNARIMDCYKKGRRMSERRKRLVSLPHWPG